MCHIYVVATEPAKVGRSAMRALKLRGAGPVGRGAPLWGRGRAPEAPVGGVGWAPEAPCVGARSAPISPNVSW